MTRYCFDTSALLDVWTRSYPPDVFPQLWRAIEEGIAAGHFFAAEEVRVEIAKKDDSLLHWARKQHRLFVDLDAPQPTAVTELLAQFPRLIDNCKGRSGADPFVVALARARRRGRHRRERRLFARQTEDPDRVSLFRHPRDQTPRFHPRESLGLLPSQRVVRASGARGRPG